MHATTAPRQTAYRRPRATRRSRHDRPRADAVPAAGGPTAIRRGSFMDHAQQFPELYPAPAAPTTAAAPARATIHRQPRPVRTPGTLFAAAVNFLTARRSA